MNNLLFLYTSYLKCYTIIDKIKNRDTAGQERFRNKECFPKTYNN